ncbi:MAG: transcription antitermination factor NusB [Furfurilactobacillus sp.]|uniref:Transcription antitermination protein NusB n=3 Tax=Furfurilactobacillus TaxID=2767882 RepID=A0A0R1RWD2_9LACO|nr:MULTISPECIES: transcription antitermination factor NusB [Furfurilactobacillus]KRL57336.1 transcription antitermination protein NusB [Furfurilactobacillus rossiae DSM 15814]MCF6160558.1 transcription antitermination factor NusB [Furfurilactobacillus milii]MCF6162790.1 transcription antitermination factor NusB [Furfurilactobacillus milii]MCF6164919.1 transcription antitermination factor NusB [Furfurilactobacillus rossiae]MCF6419849.1 transcription antitermination factor NusB [Furfurilactobaci
MSLNRHQIRKIAFQVLFAKHMNADANVEDLYRQLIPSQSDQPTVVPEYLVTLVNGVTEKEAELDEQISPLLANKWSISRLANPDLIILRLGLYEMEYSAEVPTRVALNEALELAKEFSDDNSRRFINGVLSKLFDKADASSAE